MSNVTELPSGSDGRSNANRKVLIKSVNEHLLPTAQA